VEGPGLREAPVRLEPSTFGPVLVSLSLNLESVHQSVSLLDVAIADMSLELINSPPRPPVSSTTPWRPPPLMELQPPQDHNQQPPSFGPRPGKCRIAYYFALLSLQDVSLECRSCSRDWISSVKFKLNILD